MCVFDFDMFQIKHDPTHFLIVFIRTLFFFDQFWILCVILLFLDDFKI